jgi:translation elongation factor P/translation initiation factor 5A
MSKLEIEIGDTVRIAEKSRYYMYPHSGNPKCEGVVIPPTGSWPHRVLWANGEKNSYQSYDLILIKKGKAMQFTKSDLKTGMFVKNRDGNYKVVLGGVLEVLSGMDTCTRLGTFSDSLISDNCKGLDIVAVYNVHSEGYLRTYLQGNSLTLIWERIEQTEAQKEMEVLQEQAKALQEQITKLQSKL